MSDATAVDDFGDMGRPATGIPLGSNSVTASGSSSGSLIGGGSLLPSGAPQLLNRNMPGLSSLAPSVQLFAGGNSFGRFSTGARSLIGISQALATADLRRLAMEVGNLGRAGVFSPKVNSAFSPK